MPKPRLNADVIGALVCLFALVAVFTAMVLHQEPLVYKDWGTGKCVRVEYAPKGYDCSRLPPKYEVAWVRELRRNPM